MIPHTPTSPWLLQASKPQDIATIMQLIGYAQDMFAAQGIDQWQNGYPNTHSIKQDMAAGHSYVVRNSARQIVGTAMISFDGEPTYKHIDGEWLSKTDSSYAVVHRIAIHPQWKQQGIARFILAHTWQRILQGHASSFRIDTHKQNVAMQALIKKMGFSYCGIIYVDDGSERLAFEKIVES